jgi:hypothetical protein
MSKGFGGVDGLGEKKRKRKGRMEAFACEISMPLVATTIRI